MKSIIFNDDFIQIFSIVSPHSRSLSQSYGCSCIAAFPISFYFISVSDSPVFFILLYFIQQKRQIIKIYLFRHFYGGGVFAALCFELWVYTYHAMRTAPI